MMYKKAIIDLWTYWVELLSLLLLIIGFILALFSRSAVVTYFVIFFCGLITGRNVFFRRHQLKIPIYIMVVAFLIGFILGSFYGNYKIIIVVYVAGNYIGYILHDRGYV